MSSIKINDVLNKYDYTEVSIHNFNSSWIYLNDEIILSLTNEKGFQLLKNLTYKDIHQVKFLFINIYKDIHFNYDLKTKTYI